MPNPLDDSRPSRILAFLSTQRGPINVGAIVTAVADDGETQDAARWTAALTHLASQGKVDVSGNYRKKYALARTELPAVEEPHGGLDVAAMLPPRADDPQACGTAPSAEGYDAAAEFFGAAPAGPAVRAMLAAGEDPAEAEPAMAQIVDESVRQESVQRGVPEHMLTGAEPPPPEVLSEPRIPPNVYFSDSFGIGNFYDVHTMYGMGPAFKEKWWVRRDEFPSRQDLLDSSEEQLETSTSYDEVVGEPIKNTVLRQRTGGSNDPDWLEVREVYRAAVRIRAANTGWGIDAGLDADVREARALLAEVRHQLATDAPLGEHYREDDPPQQSAAPPQRAARVRPPMSVDLGGGNYCVETQPGRYQWLHDTFGQRGVYDSVDEIREQLAAIRRTSAAPPRPASSDE